MRCRSFLFGLPAFLAALAAPQHKLGFRFEDVTARAGLVFQHNNGAFGGKYLPETMGSGCAFLDYDNDGWPDILLVNGMDWPGRRKQRSTMRLYRNNGDGTFTDVTRRAGLDIEMYGMGVAVGDYDNDGFQDIFISCVGQNRLFRNTGKGSFVDVTERAGLGGRNAFSSSALWFDYDRDGLLDLFVANYVKWSADIDVFCTMDGKQKAYCTPEAYRGATCWLFRNRGDGTFEDVTAKSGIFDTSSKSLGVAMFDYDLDGWIDLFVANDTEPNKLYHNQRDGTFQDAALRAGVALSEEGKARGGMGADAGDFDNSGIPSLVVTNFDNEMLGFYQASKRGLYVDKAPRSEIGRRSRRSLGFGCFFFDADLDGLLDLLVVNGHIDETVTTVRRDVQYAQPPHLFLNCGPDGFRDVAEEAGGGFANPKVGRGAAFADFDRDGDLDVLITTNHGPAYLYRNDQFSGNHSIRFRLIGTKSNRDAIGAVVKIYYGGESGSRIVKSGSSYLSQSELALTFGLGKHNRVDRAVITWPNGRVEEHKNLAAGRLYECVEGKLIRDTGGF
ncbi:MAG TPA: CRTAC1 family protein [Bryobacteraceae bacterium]|nr:CRTAC1 family protein [Bryobacteraceae bacterium]HOQ47615.1 CRTAC1 family protein [Bryobacteraceae bacterium]HPQ15486.1 CRTAC1 family protein [Bryobacteraceae bacterium]HPU73472.1 CRTAC1 family protein [Bryobacteraceae bacterium]